MKPLLKWAGGKRHIAPLLESHLPPDWNKGKYFEPFIGGAAFYLYLNPHSANISDINQWLIGFYNDVKSRPTDLLGLIRTFADKFDSLEAPEQKDYYLSLRKTFNETDVSLESSALFYALNKLCFNGLYRENASGKFNVPFGQKKKFPSLIESDFNDVSASLQNCDIELSDFEATVSKATAGDFVYFDPPYVPLPDSPSFTSYSSEGFGKEAQMRLAKCMFELQTKGVKAMLSNSSTPLTAEIFSGLRQVTIQAPRMVSAKSSGRGDIDELLVMNY
jgi:DNA adenine methylase